MRTTHTIDALDLFSVIEACYDSSGDDQQWLGRITENIGALLDDGLGVMANLYGGDVEESTGRTDVAFSNGFPIERMAEYDTAIGATPVVYARWFGVRCGSVHALGGLEPVTAAMSIFGGRDLYAINGRDANGFGICIGAPLRNVGRAHAGNDELWTRVATHLAGGYRVRRSQRERRDTPVRDEVRRAALTQREELILGRAAVGLTNKEIAYELGLSDSTVRVLLARAAARLGVKRRDEAVARFQARTLS